MSRSRALLALLPVALAGGLSTPAPAGATPFTQQWALPGWTFLQDIGNADSDPQHELMFANKADGHLAIVDGLTGVIAMELPQFTSSNTQLTTVDTDGDGRVELFFSRPPNGPVTPLTVGYHWNGSAYATLFSHTDPVSNWGLTKLRTTDDALELSSSDVVVRDLAGVVRFRASTAIPGWSGTGVTAVTMDIDGDGVEELGVIENQYTPTMKVHFFQYAGGFTPAWTVTGWLPMGTMNTDGDPQPEIAMENVADGHYGIFDGPTGALEKDFPGYSAYDNMGLNAIDTDGDGISELYFQRPDFLASPRLFVAYRWSGGSYVPVFSHTDPLTGFSFVHIRGASQLDILERNEVSGLGGEIRVRSLTGTVLFRASTAIPGWSGDNVAAMETDTDHDGIEELAIEDGGTLRFVRYSGAFVQSWSTAAWRPEVELTNVDGDPQSELLAVSSGDHHFALLDTPSGVIEHEFPDFSSDNSYVAPLDMDGDGRLEMFFDRFTTNPQLFAGYDWTPSGYTTLLSHNDETEGLANAHLRTPATTEFVELAANDVRVRGLSGVVLFRASTDLSGWTGVNRDVSVLDLDGDGISEMLVSDDASVRMVRSSGLASVPAAGHAHGIALLGSVPNPFRVGTVLRFSTAAAGDVDIRVYDTSGRLVRRFGERMDAGDHEVRWDGRDEQGHAAPSGILFYEVAVDGARRTGRMVRLGR